MKTNIYDEALATVFTKSDEKPDKKFSFLPTILDVLGNVSGKTVLDLGCGDGFFTIALAKAGADHVVGIDNSTEQIRLANEKSHPKNISYILADIYKNKLPQADIILTPFVANYAKSIEELDFLFTNIYKNLSAGGKAVFVVDMPTGKNLKKFGSVKTLLGPATDVTPIQIDLFNGEDFICTLYSHYYTKETLEETLQKAGFKNIMWHKPLISEEGLNTFGKEFWAGFTENTELGYLSAEK